MCCFRISVEYFNTFHAVVVAGPKVSAVAVLKPMLGCILSQFHPFASGTIFKQLKSEALVFYCDYKSGLLLVHSDTLDIEVHCKSVIQYLAIDYAPYPQRYWTFSKTILCSIP